MFFILSHIICYASQERRVALLSNRIAQMDEAIRKIPGLVDLMQQSLLRPHNRTVHAHRPSLAPGAATMWLNCLHQQPESLLQRVPHHPACRGFVIAIHENWSSPDSLSTFWQVPVVNTGFYGSIVNELRVLLGGEVGALQQIHDELSAPDTNKVLVGAVARADQPV